MNETPSLRDHRYQDSLHCDTSGLPSKERVKWAIKGLEIGWWEGTRMRLYYGWKRNGKMLAEAFWWAFLLLAMGWVTYAMVAAVFDWLLGGMGAR